MCGLSRHECDGLVCSTSASDNTLPSFLVHVTRFSTDERLVYFNLSGKFGSRLVLHSLADSMKHKPSGFLSQSKIPRNLIRTYAVLTVCDKPHGRKPLVQADGRLVQDSSNL